VEISGDRVLSEQRQHERTESKDHEEYPEVGHVLSFPLGGD
jgi:hypothetical protein